MTTYTLSIVVEGQDRASGPLGGIAGAIGRIGEIAGGILSAGALMQVGQGILNIGSQAINATAQMQAFEMGLQTLVTRELRAADSTLTLEQAFAQAGPRAEQLSDAIRQIAITSPYELSQVQDTFRLAMAFGFASDEAASFTKGMLNMAAGVGASNEMLGRMAYNLAQIRLQGKVTATDIRQLAMAGFDLNAALKDIGEQFGVTIEDHEDFNRAIEQGKIKWEDFATAFEAYAEKNFGGAADRMARTFEGLKSTFADFFLLTAPSVLGPALQAVTDFANEILNSFIALADSGVLDVWGQRLGESVTGFMDKLRQLRRLFFLVNIGAMDVGTAIGAFLGINPAGFQTLAGALSPIITAFENMGRDLGPLAALAVRGLADAFGNFAQFVIEQGPAILDVLANMFANIIEFGTEVISNVMPFLVEQFVKLSDWFVTNGPLITATLQLIGQNFATFLDILSGAWAWLEPLLSGMVNLLLNFSTMVMQIFTGDLPGAFATLQVLLVGVFESLGAAVVAFLDWIASWFGTSLAEIGLIWSNNWNMLVTILTTVAGRVISSVLQFLSNTQNLILNGLNLIKSAWTAGWNALSELATNIGNKIVQGVTAMVSSMGSAISGGASAMYSAGVNLLQGLYDGIASMAGKILDYVSGLAADIADAFAGVLDIRSPSRVFFGFGENIPQGLVNGIRSAFGLVDQTVGQMAQATISPFAAARSSVGATYNTGGVTIIVNGAGDPEAVADQIMRKLMAQGVVPA